MTYLRKILEELHGYPNVDREQCTCGTLDKRHDCCREKRVDLAHQQILALIPKRKDNDHKEIDDCNCEECNEIVGFNQAISEMEQSMTKEGGEMKKYIEPNDPRIPEAIKTAQLLCSGVRPYDDTIKVCHLQILIKIAQRYMLSGTPEEPKEI